LTHQHQQRAAAVAAASIMARIAGSMAAQSGGSRRGINSAPARSARSNSDAHRRNAARHQARSSSIEAQRQQCATRHRRMRLSSVNETYAEETLRSRSSMW